MEIPPDACARLLKEAPVARLATLGLRGEPVQVPIVYVRRGDRLFSPIDGKPKRGGGVLARVRNVLRDARVSVLVDGYGADWRALWWIRVAGRARVLRSADATAALEALRRKYPQYAHTPLSDASGTLLAIEIERLRSWAASASAWEAAPPRDPG